MLRIMAMDSAGRLRKDVGLGELKALDPVWFWADIGEPDEAETRLLDEYFHFHPLAIEDCLHLLQRPKVDHYDDVHFFVLHALEPETLRVQEVNLFLGPNFAVTFHFAACTEIDEAWRAAHVHPKHPRSGHLAAAHTVMDRLVDRYFPSVYELEDQLLDADPGSGGYSDRTGIDQVFEIRSKLLRLRKTIVPMRDLLYRLTTIEAIPGLKEYRAFFHDIYDHLLKQAETLEACRDMTADMRDSYMSYSSNRMNGIMKTLTVITTIFMPLTFLAGIYGMNFVRMPELQWRYGYFGVLAGMGLIAAGMFAWFKRKGWFD
ncbi:magnesium/cobalt transporter CorA [Paenibacillus albicereus]|uniref:Magnesium transport protein CorA n=1 Tax=Paenibacillus albicereus TaxID=2726185 RepID=A0A6H2GXR4_9BACL|nr:magnesium/cobalt transporter CorA [Paenibacillus albicereus]QJC52195.1 magnesium/cobalt transporter CorA [Paenibacillus albicereus]